MSDIINRQAAIEEALGYLEGDCFCDETDFRSLINDLENLPSAEPEWIPCSEHLPKKNGTYIVTEKVFSVDDYHHKGKYQIKVEPVDFFWRSIYESTILRSPCLDAPSCTLSTKGG